MYLEYASGADGSSGRSAVDEVRKTASDLTAVGRSDLSFLLGNYSKGAASLCGPWLTGDEFRRYSTDEQICAAWREAAAGQNLMMNLRVNVFAAQFKGLADTYFAGLRGCYETDQYKHLLRADAEERWNAACRLAASVGLQTEGVSPPDFSSLKAAEEPAAPVVTPPSTQGQGARITRPRIPWSASDSGTVQLEVFVGQDGRPGEVKVKSSSGSPAFDDSAVKEVRTNWLLVPGKIDNVPTAMWHTVGISFKRD
jgi:TonB family protein